MKWYRLAAEQGDARGQYALMATIVYRQQHGGQMSEDELQELVETVAEAHAGLSEVAFKLRREQTPKGPALKATIKAERETFRLKHELGRLDIEDPEPAKGASHCPRFTGENDRCGPATAEERFDTTSREHVSRERDEPPAVFRVQPEGAPGT